MALPAIMDYRTVRGLSKEVQQKLNQHLPETLGQAARISGITPAAISLLLVHLKRGFRAEEIPASKRVTTSETANSEPADKKKVQHSA